MSMFEGISLASLTAPTLVGIFVLLMYLGRVVAKSTYDDKKEEAERWRLAYEAEREARATSDAQTVELLELAKTTHNIIVAMFGATTSSRDRPSEGAADGSVVPTKR